jgi:hypothetical protein
MKRAIAATIGALAFAGAGATGASAGEVKGPPGVPCGAGTSNPICVHNTNDTGALAHANSACAASGLNDMDPEAGQTASIVQTAADSWKFYGLPKGAPGKLGLCRGGTGER